MAAVNIYCNGINGRAKPSPSMLSRSRLEISNKVPETRNQHAVTVEVFTRTNLLHDLTAMNNGIFHIRRDVFDQLVVGLDHLLKPIIIPIAGGGNGVTKGSRFSSKDLASLQDHETLTTVCLMGLQNTTPHAKHRPIQDC